MSSRIVQKPFRSGHCLSCHKQQTLCWNCSQYVNQDYVTEKKREVLVGEHVEKLCCYPRSCIAEDKSDHAFFPLLLRNAGLSRRERKVLKLHFFESFSFSQIAEKLRISRGSALKTGYRGIKKLKSRQSKYLYMKGTRAIPKVASAQPSEDSIPFSTKPHQLRKLSTYKYRGCPRCGAKMFHVARDFKYCMDCLWNSDAEQNLNLGVK